jgi:hypothetical protein
MALGQIETQPEAAQKGPTGLLPIVDVGVSCGLEVPVASRLSNLALRSQGPDCR